MSNDFCTIKLPIELHKQKINKNAQIHYTKPSNVPMREPTSKCEPVYCGLHNGAWPLLVEEGFSRKQLCAFTQRSERGGFL